MLWIVAILLWFVTNMVKCLGIFPLTISPRMAVMLLESMRGVQGIGVWIKSWIRGKIEFIKELRAFIKHYPPME